MEKVKVKDSFEEYLAKKKLQSSSVKYLKLSAKHYIDKDLVDPNLTEEEIQAKEKETKAQLMGSALHCLVLQPTMFNSEYTYLNRMQELPNPEKDYRNPENKAARDLFYATCKSEGIKVLEEKEYNNVVGMAESLTKNKVFMQLIQGLEVETSHYLYDENLGEEIQLRPDAFSPEKMFLVSLKSTKDASPKGFGRDCENLCYIEKEAFYRKYLEMFYGQPLSGHCIVAVENKFPYYNVIYNIPTPVQELGEHLLETYLSRLKTAKESETYQGYEIYSEPDSFGIVNLEIPAYAFKTLNV